MTDESQEVDTRIADLLNTTDAGLAGATGAAPDIAGGAESPDPFDAGVWADAAHPARVAGFVSGEDSQVLITPETYAGAGGVSVDVTDTGESEIRLDGIRLAVVGAVPGSAIVAEDVSVVAMEMDAAAAA